MQIKSLPKFRYFENAYAHTHTEGQFNFRFAVIPVGGGKSRRNKDQPL